MSGIQTHAHAAHCRSHTYTPTHDQCELPVSQVGNLKTGELIIL